MMATCGAGWPARHVWSASVCRHGRTLREKWWTRLGEFSAEWLRLREPADTAARSSRLAQAVARVLTRVDPIHALDLGAGTGANARYLSEYFPVRQDWLLVDHDEDLLAEAIRLMRLSPALGGGRVSVRA